MQAKPPSGGFEPAPISAAVPADSAFEPLPQDVPAPPAPPLTADEFKLPSGRGTLVCIQGGRANDPQVTLNLQRKKVETVLAFVVQHVRAKNFDEARCMWEEFRAEVLLVVPETQRGLIDDFLPPAYEPLASVSQFLVHTESRLQLSLMGYAASGPANFAAFETFWEHIRGWSWVRSPNSIRFALAFGDRNLSRPYVSVQVLVPVKSFVQRNWVPEFQRLIHGRHGGPTGHELYHLVKLGLLPRDSTRQILEQFSRSETRHSRTQLSVIARVLDYYIKLTPGIWQSFEEFPHLALLVWVYQGNHSKIVEFFMGDHYHGGPHARTMEDLKIFTEACVRTRNTAALKTMQDYFRLETPPELAAEMLLLFGQAWLSLGDLRQALKIISELENGSALEKRLAMKLETLKHRTHGRVSKQAPVLSAGSLTPIAVLRAQLAPVSKQPSTPVRRPGLSFNPNIFHNLTHQAALHAPVLSAAWMQLGHHATHLVF